MYYGDYGNFGKIGQPGPFDGVRRGTTERTNDALPISNPNVPIFKRPVADITASYNRSIMMGLEVSQRGMALAELGAYAQGLSTQSPEVTQRVTNNMNSYMDIYPYA